MRSGEARQARWNFVTPDGWLRLPGEITKNRRPRRIPLAAALRQFLEDWADRSEWLIPEIPPDARTRNSTVDQAFTRFWERAHRDLRVPRQAFGHIEGRLHACPTHAFRACFSSGLKSLGVRWDAVEAILGHGLAGVARHYDWLDDEMQKAVEIVPALGSTPRKTLAIGGRR